MTAILDCGNCGYWKMNEDFKIKVPANGACNNLHSDNYLQKKLYLNYCMDWRPEGGLKSIK
jgi:hypothetical protein